MTTGAATKRPAWVAALALVVGVLGWWFFPSDDGTEPTPSHSASISSSPAPASPGSSLPGSSGLGSSSPSVDANGFEWIDDEEIPDPGNDVLDAIEDGGPFEYEPHDGSVFGNREGLLPAHERGYYREYTVETPGLGHRGARRIVAGRGGELYWTDDHYASFERIRR